VISIALANEHARLNDRRAMVRVTTSVNSVETAIAVTRPVTGVTSAGNATIGTSILATPATGIAIGIAIARIGLVATETGTATAIEIGTETGIVTETETGIAGTADMVGGMTTTIGERDRISLGTVRRSDVT
jgi:hypothetical protein